MKKSLILGISFAVLVWISGMTSAAAQGHGRGQGGGKPATTGLEHAENTANPHGVNHGIENAEAKQGNRKKHHKKHHKKHGTTPTTH